MKNLIFFGFAAVCVSSLFAADPAVIARPDLKSPLPKEWVLRQGTWEVKDGEITATEKPEEKHAAVLWHQVPLQAGAVDCEFKFEGAKVFILGCDGDRHIGRIVINGGVMKLVDDSTEVKGKSGGTTLAEAKFKLKSGEWYPLHYEWNGDRMAASIGDLSKVEATHANLGKKKARWWFAVGGASMKIRSIKVTEPR